MALLSDYTAGTISVADGDTAVTGVGTAWLAAEFQEGDLLFANGYSGVVLSVESNTALTLAQPWRGGALAGSSYRLRYQSDGSRFSAQARKLIELLGGTGNLEALGGLQGAANMLAYFSGAGQMDLTEFTPAARDFLAAADDAEMLEALGLGTPGTKGKDILSSTDMENLLSKLGPVFGGVAPVPSAAGVGLADGNFNTINVPGVYTIANDWANGPAGAASSGYNGILMVLARQFSNSYQQIFYESSGNVHRRYTTEVGGTNWPNGWERLPRLSGSNIWAGSQLADGGGAYVAWMLSRNGMNGVLEALSIGALQLATSTNHPITIRTNSVERARYTETGDYLIGTDAAISTGSGSNTGHYFVANGRYIRRSNGYQPFIQARLNSGGAVQEFFYDYTQVGVINISSTATSYGTSSDYRLKENVEPLVTFALTEDQFDLLDDCLLRVMTYQPVSFTWRSTGELTHGFIAHELQQVAPHAVAGEKDGMRDLGTITIPEHTIQVEDPETGEMVERIIPEQRIENAYQDDTPEGATWEKTHDEPAFQSVDASKLVADLTASVQSLTVLVLEQHAKIEGLTCRIGR